MISFLFRHRERAPLLSKRWLKMWAKRLLHLPGLVGQSIRHGKLRSEGARIAPSVILSNTRVEGSGRNLSIGNFSGIGRAVLQCHDSLSIGAYVVINDGVRIITGSHDINSPRYDHMFKPITIEDYVWVASDAIVLQGVTLGRGCVVAAGSVVTKSVEPLAVVAGNPAVVKSKRADVEFEYMPSTWHSLFEAWLGRNSEKLRRRADGNEVNLG